MKDYLAGTGKVEAARILVLEPGEKHSEPSEKVRASRVDFSLKVRARLRLQHRESLASRGRRKAGVEADDRHAAGLPVGEDDGGGELEGVSGSKVVDSRETASRALHGFGRLYLGPSRFELQKALPRALALVLRQLAAPFEPGNRRLGLDGSSPPDDDFRVLPVEDP